MLPEIGGLMALTAPLHVLWLAHVNREDGCGVWFQCINVQSINIWKFDDVGLRYNCPCLWSNILDFFFVLFYGVEGLIMSSLWLYDQSPSPIKGLQHILVKQLLYVACKFRLTLLKCWQGPLMLKEKLLRGETKVPLSKVCSSVIDSFLTTAVNWCVHYTLSSDSLTILLNPNFFFLLNQILAWEFVFACVSKALPTSSEAHANGKHCVIYCS